MVMGNQKVQKIDLIMRKSDGLKYNLNSNGANLTNL